MRFAVILLAIALLAGCGQDQHLGRRLTETQDKLTARVQKIDVSKAPPDLPLPKNPPKQIDIQKVLAESAKINQLKVVDVVVGSGKVVEPGKYVSVHYVGVLPDGYLFDTSFKGEAQPFTDGAYIHRGGDMDRIVSGVRLALCEGKSFACALEDS